mmetsp:Transcript_74705/g.200094  ORF Transcript_74705/g.200094 Transcript_74705/m.200094 type:complete len:210 (-) Transcript_74705:103-732(-)
MCVGCASKIWEGSRQCPLCRQSFSGLMQIVSKDGDRVRVAAAHYLQYQRSHSTGSIIRQQAAADILRVRAALATWWPPPAAASSSSSTTTTTITAAAAAPTTTAAAAVADLDLEAPPSTQQPPQGHGIQAGHASAAAAAASEVSEARAPGGGDPSRCGWTRRPGSSASGASSGRPAAAGRGRLRAGSCCCTSTRTRRPSGTSSPTATRP